MEGSATGVTQEELLQRILETQEAQRAEIAMLREENAKLNRHAPQSVTLDNRDPAELTAARLQEMSEHPFYCPACGKLVEYQQQCTGRDEAPHAPTEVVSTDEVTQGDVSTHTAAPYVTGEGKVVVPA